MQEKERVTPQPVDMETVKQFPVRRLFRIVGDGIGWFIDHLEAPATPYWHSVHDFGRRRGDKRNIS